MPAKETRERTEDGRPHEFADHGVASVGSEANKGGDLLFQTEGDFRLIG